MINTPLSEKNFFYYTITGSYFHSLFPQKQAAKDEFKIGDTPKAERNERKK